MITELRRGADEVHNMAARHVPAAPSRAAGGATEIDFLEIHEELFVKQANILKNLAPDDHARARDPIGRTRLIRRRRRDDAAVQYSRNQPQAKPTLELAENA